MNINILQCKASLEFQFLSNFMVITYGQITHPGITTKLLHFVSFHWIIDNYEGNVVCD